MAECLTELLVPNFLNFLKKYGKVTFIDELPKALQLIMAKNGVDITPRRHYLGEEKSIYGKRHLILLNESFLGFLDSFEDLGELKYEGKVPGFKTESGEESLRLIYREEPGSFGIVGRVDGWAEIPFP